MIAQNMVSFPGTFGFGNNALRDKFNWMDPVKKKLSDLAKRISAVYTSNIDSSINYQKVGEFTIAPSGVFKENFWNFNGTGTSISVTIAPQTVTNSFIVACVILDTSSSSGGITVPQLNSIAMTSYVQTTTANSPRVLIAGIANAASGSQVFTATLPYSSTWRVGIFQFSGVNLTSPVVNTASASITSTTNNVTVTSVPYGMLVDCGGGNLTPTPTGGQTVDYANCCGHLPTTTTSYTGGYSYSSSIVNTIGAITLNPA